MKLINVQVQNGAVVSMPAGLVTYSDFIDSIVFVDDNLIMVTVLDGSVVSGMTVLSVWEKLKIVRAEKYPRTKKVDVETRIADLKARAIKHQTALDKINAELEGLMA